MQSKSRQQDSFRKRLAEEATVWSRRRLNEETHSSAMDSGEAIEIDPEGALTWVSGKTAVGSSREPGRTVFEGGNTRVSVAILRNEH